MDISICVPYPNRSASWGTSPTRDLSIGYYAVKRDLYEAEIEKAKESGSVYNGLWVVISLFIGMFLISIFLIYLGWGGAISYLFK